jgi:hypothetical protein
MSWSKSRFHLCLFCRRSAILPPSLGPLNLRCLWSRCVRRRSTGLRFRPKSLCLRRRPRHFQRCRVPPSFLHLPERSCCCCWTRLTLRC